MSEYRDYVERVRVANPILEVLKRYNIPVESDTSLCPFHPDSRPSLSITPARGLFHCFGCHAGGDVFAFVQKMDGSGFRESVAKLAAAAGIPPYQPILGESNSLEVERQIAELTDWVTRYYHAQLTPSARAYVVEQRGLPAAFLDTYLVGWANGRAAEAVMTYCGPDWLPIMEKAGLASSKRTGDGIAYRDHFFDRITFPILRDQRAIFLSGRAIDGREPRYLHQKGIESPLVNEDALNPDWVLVVEGALDTYSLLAWELPVVGLQGGLRASVIGKLRRPRMVYTCLDPDRAGQESTLKLAVALGLTKVLCVRLPNGQDPNDYCRAHTVEDFKALMIDACDPLEFALDLIPKEIDWLRFGGWINPALHLLASIPRLDADVLVEKVVAPRFGLGRATLATLQRAIDDERAKNRVQCPACGTALVSKKG